MADLENTPQRKGLRKRALKKSTRVDFTPLVDLGFLLITFFMLTTSMVQPYAMDITFPADGPPTDLEASLALTLLPAGGNKVFVYSGEDMGAIHPVSFKQNELRRLLLTEKQLRPGLTVLIKPADESTYQNLIDVVDELNICGINRYTITDISAEERNLVPIQ